MTEELNKTVGVREGEELDVTLVDSLIKERVDGLSGTPNIRQFASGHSNLTYSIQYENQSLVLRRPPFGTRPKSGHSMIREFSVMNALKPAYPAVPDTYFHMTDEESPLGAEFYVMEQVEGRKLERDIPAEWNFGESEGRKLCLSFFQKLVDLHNVNFKAVGLEGFGKPEGYVERQVLGWNSRYEKALTDDVETFEDVRRWLEDKMPAGEVGHSVLHGDYRLDNVILDADNPFDIKAVLDWEISALGDPLMD
ncbi:MAG: phosphotransferase family protein, partial [Kordiimonas sp.]